MVQRVTWLYTATVALLPATSHSHVNISYRSSGFAAQQLQIRLQEMVGGLAATLFLALTACV